MKQCGPVQTVLRFSGEAVWLYPDLGPVAPTVVSAAVKLRARMGCTIDVLRHVPTVLSYALHLRVA